MPPQTPSNGEYMVAAYIVTAAIYLLYALSLWVRTRKANKF
jgi:hypothetical protein